MRLQGKITQWDDTKGFGFIVLNSSDESLFVHITDFVNQSRRPSDGDIVTYQKSAGRQGKSKAIKVRFADEGSRNSAVKKHTKESQLPVAFATIFVMSAFIAAHFERTSWLVPVAIVLLSLITFLAYGWDKALAKNGQSRTAESALHSMSLLGGWPGGLLGQRLYRHKSSKREFLNVFWFTVILNVSALGYLVYTGDTGFANYIIDDAWNNILQYVGAAS